MLQPVLVASEESLQKRVSRLPSNDALRSSRDACVMIVDDECINIEIVQSYLEEEGFCNFVTTDDSQSAIEVIRKQRPDLILLDIKMPIVSGLDILKEMRSDEELRLIPVVILTASNDSETKLQALRLGATDFLAKPIDPSELQLRLENVLSAKASCGRKTRNNTIESSPTRILQIPLITTAPFSQCQRLPVYKIRTGLGSWRDMLGIYVFNGAAISRPTCASSQALEMTGFCVYWNGNLWKSLPILWKCFPWAWIT